MLEESVLEFVNSTLLPELNREVKSVAKTHTSIDSINVEVFNSPYIDAHIKHLGLQYYEVTISTGYLIRIGAVFSLIESNWRNHEDSKNAYTFDLEHPFEAWVYHNDDPVGWCFTATPNLLPIFMDIYEEEEQWQKIREFLNKKSYQIGFETGEKGTQIRKEIPSNINDKVKIMMIIWFRFVINHELGHLILGHKYFLNRWFYQNIREVSTIGANINSYKCKATEVDADSFAFSNLIDPMNVSEENSEDLERVMMIYLSVGIGISCFDLERRSTFEYYGHDSLYPSPEIRFLLMNRILSIHAKKNSELFNKLYETALELSVISFQNLGLAGGAFFMLAGKITSLDNQFSKELASAEAVREEINRIRIQYSSLKSMGYVSKEYYDFLHQEWEYIPFGETKDSYKEKLTEWLKDTFTNPICEDDDKGENIKNNHMDMISKNLKERADNLNEGDLMLVSRSPSSRTRLGDFDLNAKGIWVVTVIS
ncbi:hypothetical protein KC685_04925 [Candidatus Dojkabacteria bacterium]|uniref:Uncharacterized protein n=1 Tax=Candidatus Dojkabacteria bacterium TaxID=2099670 RepID=A0A955I3P6_9BACT|nr:hypothetical protein [Candidatus Dojkabacteria bacterium]